MKGKGTYILPRPLGINFEYQTLDLAPFLRQAVMFL